MSQASSLLILWLRVIWLVFTHDYGTLVYITCQLIRAMVMSIFMVVIGSSF